MIGHDHRFKAAVSERAVNHMVSAAGSSDVFWIFERDFGGSWYDNVDAWLEHSPATYGRALTAVSRAAELAPDSVPVANTLATICYRAGEYARAAEIAERLISGARSGGQAPSPFDLAIRAMR